MSRPKTFTEFADRFMNGGETVIDVPDDVVTAWPTVVVRHGRYTAVVTMSGHGDHLCIDVHPFVAGRAARAGVFGMEAGRRIELPADQTEGTSHQFPATPLVAVLIGEQKNRAAGS